MDLPIQGMRVREGGRTFYGHDYATSPYHDAGPPPLMPRFDKPSAPPLPSLRYASLDVEQQEGEGEVGSKGDEEDDRAAVSSSSEMPGNVLHRSGQGHAAESSPRVMESQNSANVSEDDGGDDFLRRSNERFQQILADLPLAPPPSSLPPPPASLRRGAQQKAKDSQSANLKDPGVATKQEQRVGGNDDEQEAREKARAKRAAAEAAEAERRRKERQREDEAVLERFQRLEAIGSSMRGFVAERLSAAISSGDSEVAEEWARSANEGSATTLKKDHVLRQRRAEDAELLRVYRRMQARRKEEERLQKEREDREREEEAEMDLLIQREVMKERERERERKREREDKRERERKREREDKRERKREREDKRESSNGLVLDLSAFDEGNDDFELRLRTKA